MQKSLSLSLSLSLLASAAVAQTVPGPPPAPAPMVELKAAYPYGEPLATTVVPGNARAIVVQGAALTVVDLTTLDAQGEPLALLAPGAHIELAPITTLALRYREGAQGQHAVYLAGGSAGLWQVELCGALFTSSTPTTCAAVPLILDRAGCEDTFAWKRCVDVDVIEGHFAPSSDGLLVALYAASSDPRKRMALAGCPGDLGANELRAWRIAADGSITPYATHLLDETGVNAQQPVEEVATALALDPADPSVVYVALGAGGVRKVLVNAPLPAVSVVPFPGVPTCGLPNFSMNPTHGYAQYLGGPGCPAGEQVRDLAIVSTPTLGSLLYAVLEYGRVVELRLATGQVTGTHTFPIVFPQRVAAYADGDEVLVAVGFQDGPGTFADSAAPYRPTGLWSDVCIAVGTDDVNNITGFLDPDKRNVIRFLTRNATQTLAPLAGIGELPVSARWNQLEFVPTTTSFRARLYAGTSVDGLQGWRTTRSGALAWSVLDAWSGGRPYAGTAFAINEATLSLVDSALGGGGFDGWRADVPGRMFALVAGGGAQDVAPVAKTVSACATRDEEFPRIQCQFQGPDTPILADPRPFVLQTGTSSAQWLDPYDPLGQTEWFVSGDETSWHALPPVICAPGQPCSWVSDATRCVPSPCPANNPCSSWGRRTIPGASSDVGWLVTRLRTGAAPPGTVRGDQMELAWWQLPANHLNTSERSNTAPYTTSTADPRTLALGPHGVQVPKFLHLVRNGARDGVRIVRTEWVLERARGAAAACPPDQRGNGEPLGTPSPAVQAQWGANSDLEMRSVLTHVELAAPGCEVWIAGLDCWTSHDVADGRLRHAWNNKAHVFSVPDPAAPAQPRWILGVAAGFVTTATGQNPAPAKNATCAWKDHYRRALTVFYDVTHLDAGISIEAAANTPLLLAVALGPDPATEPLPPFGGQHGPELVAFDTSRGSHAFALRTKAYPQPGGTARTLAFVADLLGRVLVYDVSWDRLKPAAGSGFTPMPLPGDGSQPLLFPGRIHRFVASPVDGWRPNCTDLEIDEHVLYCATVRDGVQLLEIGPGMPSLAAPPQPPAEGLPVYGVLDTAGMATGLALRRPSALNRQMDQLLVGDNRAGLLVFGRTGN